MESIGGAQKYQKIWESLIFPKDYHLERKHSYNTMIFFIITGSVGLKINNGDSHFVYSHEMFITQNNSSCELIMLEQTHLIICYVSMEAWYHEQKNINELITNGIDVPEGFFKLPIRKMLIRFLSLLDLYLKEGIHTPYFFELKLKELFFLLYFCYKKNDLVRFLQDIISEDMQFRTFVLNNYLIAGNVQALAKLANYSTSGFIKKFQKCFNDSPYKWMQKQKAKQISIEILKGTKSLQEIASEFNFSSYQHFSVFCKANLGAPPTTILANNISRNV